MIFEGANDYSNPIDPFDVTRDGDLTARDALAVINELGRRLYSDRDDQSVLDPQLVDLENSFYYDATKDLRITSLDALVVINALSRRAAGEGVADTNRAIRRVLAGPSGGDGVRSGVT